MRLPSARHAHSAGRLRCESGIRRDARPADYHSSASEAWRGRRMWNRSDSWLILLEGGGVIESVCLMEAIARIGLQCRVERTSGAEAATH